jgi:hypothetical protein
MFKEMWLLNRDIIGAEISRTEWPESRKTRPMEGRASLITLEVLSFHFCLTKQKTLKRSRPQRYSVDYSLNLQTPVLNEAQVFV